MAEDMIRVPRKEYEALKRQANIDVSLLKQFLASFKDLKLGRIRRVK